LLNPYSLFLLKPKAQKKKLSKKKMPFFALKPCGLPLLKKRSKTTEGQDCYSPINPNLSTHNKRGNSNASSL
jgi:hypothetical protein